MPRRFDFNSREDGQTTMKKVASGLSALCLSALLALPAYAESTAGAAIGGTSGTSGTTSNQSVVVGTDIPGTRSTSFGPGTVGISGYGGSGSGSSGVSSIGTSEFSTGARSSSDSPANRITGAAATGTARTNAYRTGVSGTGTTRVSGLDGPGTNVNPSAFPYSTYDYNPDGSNVTTLSDGNYAITGYAVTNATGAGANWNWLGMLGLIGLAGLFGRQRGTENRY